MSKILIIGSGGREHALAWKLSQDNRIEEIYIAPGNAGTSQIGKNIAISALDINSLMHFAKKNKIDLTVIGPDNTLALGIVDLFMEAGLRIFGPTIDAVKIESSKSFAKEMMKKNNIPTAKFEIFEKYENALQYICTQKFPIVVKASGLALGKGVYICKTLNDAKKVLGSIMIDKIHGNSGDKVIIEEFLKGQEVSCHFISDGKTFAMLPISKDHKQIYDNDEGPNTGGMGSVCPIHWSIDFLKIRKLAIEPMINALQEKGISFKGCLFPGIMITEDGFRVLEFNVRFGDPETQSYMRLLKTDLLDILNASIDGHLEQLSIEWHKKYCVCVVLVSKGYPGKYEKGFKITGIKEAEKNSNIIVFHAGTEYTDKLITSGGRVLGVTGIGDTLKEAIDSVYKAIDCIKFEGMYYRKDIGLKINTG